MKSSQIASLACLAAFGAFGTGCMNGVPLPGGAGQTWNTGFGQGGGDQSPAEAFDSLPEEDDESFEDAEDVSISGGDEEEDSSPTEDITPLEFAVEGRGYDDIVSFRVDTNQILKVQFRADPQQSTVAGTGFSPTYTGLGVYIKVGTVSKPTPLLYNGANGGAAQISPVLSFAGAYTNPCASTDNTCRTRVTVRVIKPNYDHYCLNYPGGFMNGNGQYVFPCNPPGYTHVYETHPWHGTIFIYTDDTGAPSN